LRDVVAQHPERGPQSLPARDLHARHDPAVALGAQALGLEARRGVGLAAERLGTRLDHEGAAVEPGVLDPIGIELELGVSPAVAPDVPGPARGVECGAVELVVPDQLPGWWRWGLRKHQQVSFATGGNRLTQTRQYRDAFPPRHVAKTPSLNRALRSRLKSMRVAAAGIILAASAVIVAGCSEATGPATPDACCPAPQSRRLYVSRERHHPGRTAGHRRQQHSLPSRTRHVALHQCGGRAGRQHRPDPGERKGFGVCRGQRRPSRRFDPDQRGGDTPSGPHHRQRNMDARRITPLRVRRALGTAAPRGRPSRSQRGPKSCSIHSPGCSWATAVADHSSRPGRAGLRS
jgi:hypothetical protein